MTQASDHISSPTSGTKFLWLKTRAMQLLLIFEFFWPPLWPATATFGFYIAFSLFDPWSHLPPWLQVACLLITLSVALGFFIHAFRLTPWPTKKQAMRRLEENANLSHRPLDDISDKPAYRWSSLGLALWKRHKETQTGRAKKAKVGLPHTSLQQNDPMATRALLIFGLLLGFLVAGNDSFGRINAGLNFSLGKPANFAVVDAWVTPPDYTHLPPKTLFSSTKAPELKVKNDSFFAPKTLKVPLGSTVEVHVNGTGRTPKVIVGDKSYKLNKVATNSYTLTTPMQRGESLTIDLGSGFAQTWPLELIPDVAPSISFTHNPDATDQNALRVRYMARDDYGIKSANLEIKRVGFSDGEVIRLSLVKALVGNDALNRQAYFDLTPHKWAGFSVNGKLYVTDGLDQRGTSENITFTLPSRQFKHPIANQLVEIRKSLFISPKRTNGPRRRIEMLSSNPEAFNDDLMIYSGLRTLFYRLRWAKGQDDIDTTTDLMWDMALRLEDGNETLARNQMAQTLDAMDQALQNGDDKAFDELAKALDDNLNEFMKSLQDMPQNETQNSGEEGQTIDMQTIRDMIKQMRELQAAGKKEEAQKILEQLKNIMRNLRMSKGGEGNYEQMMEGSKALNKLEGLKNRQKRIKNQTETEKALSKSRPANDTGSKEAERAQQMMDMLSRQQGALNSELDDVNEALDKSGNAKPKALGEAGEAMKQSEEALKAGKTDEALQAQQKALDAMGEASKELADQLAKQLAQTRQNQNGKDPLGRNTGLRDQLEIPDKSEMEEARAILDLLRKRLSDPNRSDDEKEYLRRLLRQFK